MLAVIYYFIRQPRLFMLLLVDDDTYLLHYYVMNIFTISFAFFIHMLANNTLLRSFTLLS